MSMNVNKKIVLTTLIWYSIHRFGFGAPDFHIGNNIINSGVRVAEANKYTKIAPDFI